MTYSTRDVLRSLPAVFAEGLGQFAPEQVGIARADVTSALRRLDPRISQTLWDVFAWQYDLVSWANATGRRRTDLEAEVRFALLEVSREASCSHPR